MSTLKPFTLQRRTFLRGAGTIIALPVLDAMLDSKGFLLGAARGQTTAFPQRLISFFITNGVPVLESGNQSRWKPTATGTGYTMTPCLAPLAPWRNDLNILSGLRLGNEGTDGNGHERGTSCFTTGTRIASSRLGPTGPSMEWQAAAHLPAGATPFKALAVASEPPLAGSPSTVFKSPNVYNHISWTAAETPAFEYRDPQALFDAIFKFAGNPPAGSGSGSGQNPAQAAALARKLSVLDSVRQDIQRLQGKLGKADQQRLEQHLTAVRQLETEIAQLQTMAPPPPSSSCAMPSRPPSQSSYATTKADLQAQLLGLAIRCDLVRYASFMLGNGNGNGGPSGSAAGVSGGMHETTHQNSSSGSLDKLQTWTTYQVSRFASLLRALKDPNNPSATAEGTGQVLDNCLVYLGSEMFDGNTHDTREMPVVLAGRGGGKHNTGRHIAYSKGQYTISHMLLAMFQMAGVPQNQFGGVTSPLPNLG